MKRRAWLGAVVVVMAGVIVAFAATPSRRVKITGEVIDPWCYLSEIMFAQGTAHHQCATWCAVGGVPVGIRADDGKVYLVLTVGSDSTGVANPALVRLASHKVTVEGDLHERDGARYLLVKQVVADHGIVNLTHAKYSIQPFGD